MRSENKAPRVQDVVEMVETLAPPQLAQDWDRIGLQVGDFEAPVAGILVALDAGLGAMEFASQENLNLVIAHHPLLFRPLKVVHWTHSVGKLLQIALTQKINVFSSHTNLDAAFQGINDILAELLELHNPLPLDPHPDHPDCGLGRIGDLSEEISLTSFLNKVKKVLHVETLRFIGNPKGAIRRVAVCGGSGASMIAMARDKGAQCYITGDLKYHEAFDAGDDGIALIDPGHFALEVVVVAPLAKYLQGEIQKKGWKVPVKAFTQAKDPFQFA